MTASERESVPVNHERLVQSVGDPIFTLDADGQFVFANDALLSALGYDRETVVGTDFRAVTVDADTDRATTAFERVVSPETDVDSVTYEKTVVDADGGRIPVETRFSRVTGPDGEPQVVGVIRDITERKERERRLQQENERLDRFASFVGHDLRNPLNVARARVEMVAEAREDGHLDDAIEALDRMEGTIDDLLTLARDGTRAEAREPVDIDTLTHEAWSALGTNTSALETPTDCTVQADRGSLTHLLENLLRNAVQHNPDPVTVTVGDRDDGGFFVADDGRGLPDDIAATVSAGTDIGEGAGIGLAIVTSVAQAHGWAVDASESADGGARFDVQVA